MRVTSMLPDVQQQLQQTQQNLSVALQQVSTGKRVNQLSDDPTASASMVRSLAASADVDRYTKTITSTLPALQNADSALSSVVTSLTSAIALGTNGASGVNGTVDRAALATEVQSVLSSVVAQANTSLDGVYAFGGTLSNSPPFVQASSSFTSAAGSSAAPLTPSTALTAGATTKVSDAGTGKTFTFTAAAGDTISTLQSAISDAVAAGTLSSGVSASINSGGHLSIGASPQVGVFVSSTDGELGGMAADSGTAVENAYAYAGTNNTNNVSIGNNLSVSAGIAGSKIFSPGNGNVLGALKQLVTALQSNDPASVASATSKVSASLKAVNEARVPIGSSVNQMNAQETSLGQETVTLSSQQTSLVGIDLAEAATNLAQAQLVQGATLAAAAKAVPQTLLDYLK